MVQYNESDLTIVMQDHSPQERRDMLIQAIAAAMRWRAHADAGAYERDGENLYVLAQLLEELTALEK